MLHRYQIENVVYVIEGIKGHRPVEDLIRNADPLGDFPELKNVQPVDGDDYASLYQHVLIDLPIGNYFRKFLDEVTKSASADDNNVLDAKYVSEILSDKTMLQIQHHLNKIWLQEFYTFCRTELGETSQRVMCDLLKFESDLQTIQIIDNYGQLSVSDGAMTYSERKKYISKVGYLYPERYEMLNRASDFKALQTAVECTPYEVMLSNVRQAGAENEVESRGKTLGK
jgi:V-type H+-transporting ATPase subunit d